MIIKTFEEFTKDRNERCKNEDNLMGINTMNIFSIMEEVYNCTDFEINEDEENITLYDVE